jgi:hypothetical protein
MPATSGRVRKYRTSSRCSDAIARPRGRNYDEIERTCPFLFDVGEDGSKTGELVEQLRGLAQMGIQKVFGRVVGDYRIEPIEIMGRDVIPAVAEL